MTHASRPPPDSPVLVDKFLDDAIEVDVDCICDGETVASAASWSTSRRPAIHSGDSACVAAAVSALRRTQEADRTGHRRMAKELGVVGLMNVQYAVQGRRRLRHRGQPAGLAARSPSWRRPSASPLAKLAAKVMMGKTLAELGFTEEVTPERFNVKVPVFPFNKFPGTDMLLSPGDALHRRGHGLDRELGYAFAKAYEAAGMRLPLPRGPRPPDRQATGTSAPSSSELDPGPARLRAAGHGRHLARPAARGAPGRARSTRCMRAARTSWTPSRTATIDMVFNTPSGHRARGTTTPTSAPPPSPRASPA